MTTYLRSLPPGLGRAGLVWFALAVVHASRHPLTDRAMLAVTAAETARLRQLLTRPGVRVAVAHRPWPRPAGLLAVVEGATDDRAVLVRAHPTGHPELSRTFQCAPWHLKQLECFLQHIRINGDSFVLHVHGDGLLAFALTSSAGVEWSTDAAAIDGRKE